ncbi:endonuclease 8-like 3 isoform X2 [Portunus trituberculatus]|uniref:endonuclease 8-like 3 isoform X2 n=1 Tax=Portunus trituberculatus TaxID=210409 RepID=UPI001E1D15BE|nr:endonuclease 8-like 3 isoform X2 [Portunus trituberculatus]
MVEGPGCKLNGEKLKKRVIGQKVVGLAGTSLQKSRIQKPDEAMAYNCFVGKRVTDVKTLGKELFVFVEAEFCLRVHFLMNGSLRFNNEFMQSDTKKKESVLKLILSTDCVYFYDISLEIRSAFESQQKYKELIDLDICSPTFNLQRAVHTIRQHTTRLICDVVLDQLVLPGVGNIIKNEALFNAGINPNTKVDELNEDLIILLVKMNRDFTKLFYECRRDGKNLYKFMKIYKKSECQECRRKVVQCKVGEYERLTFYCPGCQNNTMKLPIKSSLLGWVFHQNEVASWRCSLCLTPRPPPESFPALHHNPSATATGTKRTLDGGMQSPGSSKRSTSVGDPSNFQSSGHVKHSSSSATSHGGDHDRVVCPGHKTEARKCKVVKEGDNKGRVFYTCSKPQGQQCKFFLWGDNHHPMCHHGKVTVQRTVLKLNANNGRHFYCCSRPKNKQCDFFQWVDAEVGLVSLA